MALEKHFSELLAVAKGELLFKKIITDIRICRQVANKTYVCCDGVKSAILVLSDSTKNGVKLECEEVCRIVNPEVEEQDGCLVIKTGKFAPSMSNKQIRCSKKHEKVLKLLSFLGSFQRIPCYKSFDELIMNC